MVFQANNQLGSPFASPQPPLFFFCYYGLSLFLLRRVCTCQLDLELIKHAILTSFSDCFSFFGHVIHRFPLVSSCSAFEGFVLCFIQRLYCCSLRGVLRSWCLLWLTSFLSCRFTCHFFIQVLGLSVWKPATFHCSIYKITMQKSSWPFNVDFLWPNSTFMKCERGPDFIKNSPKCAFWR